MPSSPFLELPSRGSINHGLIRMVKDLGRSLLDVLKG